MIGARELRSELATHLRRAQSGERIVITVDGQPVAQVGPVLSTGGPTLADLIAVGMIDPPRRADRPAPPDPRALAMGISTARVLEEVRGR